MTKQEKAIREFCGHHADWWPSTTQVQEMLALAHPEQYPQIAISPEIVGYVAPQRTWVSLTEEELCEIVGVSTNDSDWNVYKVQEWLRKVEAKLKDKNNG